MPRAYQQQQVSRMPGAPKRSGFIVSMGQRYFCIFLIVISITSCSSEKSSPDSEDEEMNGFHCKEDPRCLCIKMYRGHYEMFCEDKVLINRMSLRPGLTNKSVQYVMKCHAQTEVDPYHYLAMIMFANISSYDYTVANNAHLTVLNCSAPSSNQSVLFEDWSTGSIGGLRDLPLENLEIYCEDSKTLHFSMHHWSGLEKLKVLIIKCQNLSMLDKDLFSRISERLEILQIMNTEIQYLQERFFTDVKTRNILDLSRNKLRSLSRNLLSSMRNLKYLFLGENEIESIDDDFFLKTENLSHIVLRHNSLKTLPTSLCRLKKLEVLHAGYNRISVIPEECLYSLPSLITFTLLGNKLVTLGLPSVSITPTHYKVLSSDIKFPNSSSILEQSENLNKAWIRWSLIRHLHLGNNSLSSLPDEAFYGMVNLEYLNIASNNIAHLPENIFSRNKHLTWLLASNNLFKNISATLLKNKTRLIALDLSYNLVETLDSDFFSDSSSLCCLHINNNRFRHLPNNIFQPFKTQNGTCHMFLLDMSGNRLEDVPELSIPLLTHLNLSGNHLTSIKPDMLSEAPRLLEVNLSHNLIHTVENPLELDEYKVLFSNYLIKLKIIDLSSNQLRVYPRLSPVLKTLKYLNLSGNYITEFAFKPEIRRTLSTALETFDVSRNRLKSVKFFEHWLWESGKTKYVDLSHNLIDLEECREYMVGVRFVWGCMSPLYKLTALETEVVIPGCDIDSKFSRVKLLLGHNPFVCDCEVFKLLRYASKEIRPTSALERLNGHRLVVPAVIDIQDLHCSKPDSVKGKAVADVESWAYHWLPMIGFCWKDTGVNSASAPEYDHRQKPLCTQSYHIQFAVLKVQRMSAAPKPRSLNVTMGQRCIYIAIIVISIIGCHSEKSLTDSEDGVLAGFHCKADPRCLCFKAEDDIISSKFCEEKVLLRRWLNIDTTVYYDMKCKAQTEADPYYYLSIILSANFSSPTYMDRAELQVSNCLAPSRNRSVLLGDWSTGSIGGWRNLTLEVLTIKCEESKTLHFPMHRWSALEELKELKIICPNLSMLYEDLFSRISKRLEILQITDTEVQHLPKRFFEGINTIKKLDLRRNKLRLFESSFLSNMRNLEELYLGENEIAAIEDDIFLKTENLTHLDLGRNSIKRLPTSLCKLKKLEILHAEYNQITFIPEECLCSLPSLSNVYLSGNKLVTFGLPSVSITPFHYKVLSSDVKFPNSSSIVEQSENLNNATISWSLIQHLYLDNNSLSSLPDEAFHGMVNLEYLNISSNNIAYLPENIFSRSKYLIKLLASNNLFTNISATLLRNNIILFYLDLSHNLIETLDMDFFRDSTFLCHIYFNDNRFRHLPYKIFHPFKIQNELCQEFFLDMSGNCLEDVPELSIPDLTHLRLSRNNLNSIKPDMFTQTPRLLEVNLSHNVIHTIENPLELDEYKFLFSKYLLKLQVIDLSSNRLTVYPSITPVLSTLKHLNLSRNYITEFSCESETEGMDLETEFSLEIVDLSHNRLNMVEFMVPWQFENMKHLDLSHNRINLEGCRENVQSTALVWGCLSPIHWPSTLEVIILSHNDIAYIPMEFQHYMSNLRFVDLSHNKIKRLWHGDLLYTRAWDTMDLRVAPFDFALFNPHLLPNRLPGSNNLTIDLRHNSISSLQLPDNKIGVVLPGCDIDSEFSRVKFLLGHNPFVCDCEVFKLLRYASKEMRPVSALERLNGHMLVVPAVIDIQDLHCSKPDSVKGKAVADVESWAYHLLPLIGFCWNDTGVNSVSGHKSTSSTEAGAVLKPPE
ncbi:uncharacterized protein LOC124172987 [Ischnura elegans]|uniref:uncharacterized protein LOC124172987 n=1 Tax=Ischnura elegans TaxID=197161 RepID=UPI001ED8A2F2|nr:uncharacterized protein LOC124172987 [Ischnura elegans]